MNNELQSRYWNQMAQYKFEIIYYNEHFTKCVRNNRTIIILLAVLSSGAVAGWAIWSKYSFIWSIIVASTQVLTIVNEFLPYKDRIKECPDLISKLRQHRTICNKNRKIHTCPGQPVESVENALIFAAWAYPIKPSEIFCQQDTGLPAQTYGFKAQWDDISGKYLYSDALPENNKIIIKANKLKDDYYKNLFEGENLNESQQQSEQTSNT